MEESHLRDLPFEHGVKSLWRLIVCYRERELADLKYQKKLNLYEWHIPEDLESPFAGLLHSYRSHAPLFTKFCIETATLYIYCKVQLLQALKPEDKTRRKEFAVTMLDRLESDSGFLKRVCFSDESTFHVSGLLNRHNLRT